MEWELLTADIETFRIEATDRSFWFGFEDDVVIRITAAGENGSRVDIRSLSRVGVGTSGRMRAACGRSWPRWPGSETARTRAAVAGQRYCRGQSFGGGSSRRAR